ncbi:copper resistance CopC family protein [Sphaerisporangium flaviroseum]|uniref:copper resistance CopC family protein n=1 Tax=Sphaerisporangium flaviroseum TaxID=509199 RepID=UPI0031E89AA7
MAVATSPADAHGQLALSVPAKDSTVAEPLDAVSLYFTEKPRSYAYFTLTAPSGRRVDRPWAHGEPKRLDEPITEYFLVDGSWQPRLYHEGFQVRIPVAHWPEKGTYVVHYWTVASDDDKVRGEVRFTYAGRTTAPPKGWKTPADPPSAALLAAAGETAAGETGADATGAGETGAGEAARPLPGQTPGATPSPGCTPRTMPETGCGDGTSPAGTTPPSAPGAAGESPASSGTDTLVWLLPALLVTGAGVMVARAARPSGAPGTRGQPAPGTRGRPGPGAGPAPRRGADARRAPRARRR